MSFESVMSSNHFVLCCPLLLLLSVFPIIRVFSNGSVLHIRWPKYWSFSFSISPSNEYSWLISFRLDWLDLLAVQATLKSLLQHHSSKASVLRPSAFFVVQLSHPHMTTGKTIVLTTQTLVSKVMPLLFNILFRPQNLNHFHFPKETHLPIYTCFFLSLTSIFLNYMLILLFHDFSSLCKVYWLPVAGGNGVSLLAPIPACL